MTFLSSLSIVLATLVAMEGVAWVSHRYVMHGFGWGWHASHHEKSDRWFERNDLFALVFAAGAIALVWFGTSGLWPLQWVGAGMTAYGALYFVVHDGMVHRRWPMRFVPRSGYLKRLVQAHRLHHACDARQGAVSFGFLWAPSQAQLQSEIERFRRQRRAAER